MGADCRRADIPTTQQFLNRADIRVVFEEMGNEGMANIADWSSPEARHPRLLELTRQRRERRGECAQTIDDLAIDALVCEEGHAALSGIESVASAWSAQVANHHASSPASRVRSCRRTSALSGARRFCAHVRVERVVGRVLDFASSSWPRSAALTAASFGNALDTAGSMTTTLDSFAMRRAYFPRTTGPKSLRVYSDRSQSFASDLTFVIDVPFRARCSSRADDANGISTLGMRTGSNRPRTEMPKVMNRT